MAIAFAGLIVAGLTGQAWLFVALVFLLGVGSGICASGTLTLMVDQQFPFWGCLPALRTAHKPKRGDSTRAGGPGV